MSLERYQTGKVLEIGLPMDEWVKAEEAEAENRKAFLKGFDDGKTSQGIWYKKEITRLQAELDEARFRLKHTIHWLKAVKVDAGANQDLFDKDMKTLDEWLKRNGGGDA